MATAAERLADQRSIELSADLQIQLDRRAGLRPMVAILKRARDQAAIAMNSMVYADAANIELIRAFQMEVRRYDDLVAWCSELVTEGIEADMRITEDDRTEFSQLLLSPEVAAEDAAIGTHKQGYDA